jgi:hypothetical protein
MDSHTTEHHVAKKNMAVPMSRLGICFFQHKSKLSKGDRVTALTGSGLGPTERFGYW